MQTFIARGALLVSALGLSAHGFSSAYEPELSPALSPSDHDKFFDRDYPDDKRPAAHPSFNFQHPYPVVQDSEDYEQDYVKDENKDGGEYKAHMVYDQLRSKFSAKKNAADNAWKAERASEQSLAGERKAKAAAEEAARLAREKADKAAKELAEAEAAAKAVTSTSMSKEVDSAVSMVEQQMEHLEECKKKLAEAKEALKKTLEKKAAQEKADAEKAEAAQAKVISAKANSDALADEAMSKEADAKAKEAASEKPLEDDIAAKKAEATKKDKEAEEGSEELEQAARKLRAIRHEQVDDDGGVYYHKSSTPKPVEYESPPEPTPTSPAPPKPPAKSGAARRGLIISAVLGAPLLSALIF